MSELLEHAAEMREKFGTGVARELRRKGMVPASLWRRLRSLSRFYRKKRDN